MGKFQSGLQQHALIETDSFTVGQRHVFFIYICESTDVHMYIRYLHIVPCNQECAIFEEDTVCTVYILVIRDNCGLVNSSTRYSTQAATQSYDWHGLDRYK
jgi:hypothetical protein